MTFTSLIAEQRFVLRTLADIDRLKIEQDVIDAVLEGVAQLAAGEWAPLRRVGDTIGAKWSEAGVRLPEGFAAAYRAYVEGGWGGIAAPQGFGGQNLPFALQMAVLETLGAANFAFALLPILTIGSIEALIHHGSEEQTRAPDAASKRAVAPPNPEAPPVTMAAQPLMSMIKMLLQFI